MLPCLYSTEQVYKYSKILVWNMFFYITGRMGYFANSHARLCFMDTDSKPRQKQTLAPRRYQQDEQKEKENRTVFFFLRFFHVLSTSAQRL